MSSVAVLTPESFAEHRSGLKGQEMTGCVPEDEAYIPTYLEAFPPLPEKGAPGEKAGEPALAWGGGQDQAHQSLRHHPGQGVHRPTRKHIIGYRIIISTQFLMNCF